MDPLAQRALARLQHADGAALRELARLVVEQTTATPIQQIAQPRWIAGQIAAALEAITHGDHARDWAERRIASERARWADEERTPRDFLPEEAEIPLRELLGRPYVPHPEVTFRLLDQPAIRGLIREVLVHSLRQLRQRLAAAEPSLLGEAGRRAARHGKGIFGGLGAVADNVRGVAGNLVGAVREEVEHGLDGKIREHVRSMTSDTVRIIAQHVSDPEHAPAFADLRLSVLDVLLDTPIQELTEEADKLQPEQIVDVVVGALRAAASAEDFVERTTERVESVLQEAGDGTFGAWLEEVGLLQVWTESTTELVAARLDAVVQTDGFLAWWESLFAEEG